MKTSSWALVFILTLNCINFIFREEQEQLSAKLAAIEKKIIVGGENLLEKAEEQERMLESSQQELEERKAKEEELRKVHYHVSYISLLTLISFFTNLYDSTTDSL